MDIQPSHVPHAHAPDAQRRPRLLFVSTSAQQRDAFGSLCANVDAVCTQSMAVDGAVSVGALLEQPDVDGVVLELTSHTAEDYLQVRDIARALAPKGTRFVVAAARLSPVQMVSLLRLGVDDFLPLPCTVESLRGMVAAVADLPPRAAGRWTHERDGDGEGEGHCRGAARTRRVVSFAHASGGAGASTLLVNCATSLRQSDRALRVGILDLDVQFGSIASLLDLQGRSPIMEILDAPERLDDQMLRDLMVDHPSGISVLTAPQHPVPLDALLPETVTELVATAKRLFDVVLIDLPCALCSWTANAFEGSSDIFVVTPMEVPSVHRLTRLLDTFAGEGLDQDKLTLVANRVPGRGDAGDGPSKQQVEKVIGRSIDASLPLDARAITAAANAGAPVCAKAAGPYGAGVQALLKASDLIGDHRASARGARTGLTRLFGGLL